MRHFVILFRHTTGSIGLLTDVYGVPVEFPSRSDAVAHSKLFDSRIYQIVEVSL